MATHSSILAHIVRAEENPMDRRAWQATYSPWGHKEWDTTEHACKAKIILWQLLYQSSELKGLSSSSGPKPVTMESRIHANNIPAHCPGHFSLRGQYLHFSLRLGLPRWLCGKKNPPANAGDMGSIPGSGRSSGEGNGNPLQYSCLENSTDRGAWWATVHGVTKSWANSD